MVRWMVNLSWLVALSFVSHAGTLKIVKVLPHYLDREGRVATSPSLYDRDAYQAKLRLDPTLALGIRFDVQYRARGIERDRLRVRAELRTSRLKEGQPHVVEAPVGHRRRTGSWASATFAGDDFRQAGEIIAWRVTLWDGATLLAEQRSFLW